MDSQSLVIHHHHHVNLIVRLRQKGKCQGIVDRKKGSVSAFGFVFFGSWFIRDMHQTLPTATPSVCPFDRLLRGTQYPPPLRHPQLRALLVDSFRSEYFKCRRFFQVPTTDEPNNLKSNTKEENNDDVDDDDVFCIKINLHGNGSVSTKTNDAPIPPHTPTHHHHRSISHHHLPTHHSTQEVLVVSRSHSTLPVDTYTTRATHQFQIILLQQPPYLLKVQVPVAH